MMIQLTLYRYQISISFSIVFFTILFSSCNSVPDEKPFPQKEISYNKPVTVPMVFTPEKKLVWYTAKQGVVTAVIKKSDINTCPPFSTTAVVSGILHSTGLGLCLSYDVVTQGHGRMLKVETKEGEGTTFIIILPA